MVLQRRSSTSASSRRATGSRLDDGSSSTRISGGTRARWPARPVGAARRTGAAGSGRGARACRRRRAPRRPAPRSSAPVTPKLAGPNATSSRDRRHEQLVVGVLEDDPDPAADLPQARGRHRQPADAHACRRRRGRMPLRCSTSVVLPAPFGPSSATRSPRFDAQVDPVQRLVPVGVGEREAADLAGTAAGRTGRRRVRHARPLDHARPSRRRPARRPPPAGARPVTHWRRPGCPRQPRHAPRSNPRESMARCTRSPRS